MRRFCLSAVVLSLLSSTIAAQQPTPPAKDQVIAGLSQSFSLINTRSFVKLHTQTRLDGAYNWDRLARREDSDAEFYVDGKRGAYACHNMQFSGDGPAETPQLDIRLRGVVTDQAYYYETPADKPPSVLHINREADKFRSIVPQVSPRGVALDGFLSGDDNSLPDIIRQADSVSIRPQTEDIDGHAVYVLQATTRYGKYTIWVDPAYGLAPRRIKVQKTGNDLFNGKAISSVTLNQGPLPTQPISPVISHEEIVDALKIEQVAGSYLITDARITTTRTYEDGRTTRSDSHVKRQIDPDPDFQALEAFQIDVPDGIPISYTDDRNLGGIQYRWKGGRVDAHVDSETLAQINALTPRKNNPETRQLAASAGLADSVPNAPLRTAPVATADTPNANWIAGAAAAIAACVIGALLVYRRATGGTNVNK